MNYGSAFPGLLCGVMLTSCAPSKLTSPSPEVPKITPPVAAPAPAPVKTVIKPEAPKISAVAPTLPPPAPNIPRHSLKSRTINATGITLTIVTFDRRDFTLAVADQDGLGSKWPTAQSAGAGSLAAINGGFFTPEGKPLGLVISNGKRTGGTNRASSLGSGFFIGGDERLISREAYLASKPSTQNLLQTGPRLVWNAKTMSGLSKGDRRPRSFLLWDGREHFAIGHANSATLSSLASALSKQPISGFKIHHALNLDGGRSSDLWVGSSVNGGPLTRRSWINKDVRNYLVLKRD
ncbi:phosphodiester glycosidase family protein [Akkermansiaceae bacterium]|nr:phosphodiester glycosidase family protein [Akkermansiaceae bacterium]